MAAGFLSLSEWSFTIYETKWVGFFFFQCIVTLWIFSMGPPHDGSIQRPITPWSNTLTMDLHLAPFHTQIQKHTHTHILLWNCHNRINIHSIASYFVFLLCLQSKWPTSMDNDFYSHQIIKHLGSKILKIERIPFFLLHCSHIVKSKKSIVHHVKGENFVVFDDSIP